MPNKYRYTKGGLVHRVVWQAHHGPIPPGFHVHHKNGDKADNRIQNLTLVQHGAHISMHRDRRRPETWRCDCGGDLHFAFGLCKRCYDRRYRETHREALRGKKRDDYLAKWEERKAKARAYYEANRERLKQKGRDYYRARRTAAIEAGVIERKRKLRTD